ncbi:glycosyltransferase family 2 protein [Patescibacteria group bacterium]|nr:glycosyltransferase family 2 protein [Patescibacteria group bacterium]
MKIAIITINYNGKKDTFEFLASLSKLRTVNCEQHAPPLEVKTIIVDNASSDGSVSEIKNKFPDVDILQTGANLGFAGGYNKGLEYAKIWGADFYLLINNDCLIKEENLISKLLETFEKDPKIGLISPKIYFAPGFEFHKERYSKNDSGKIIWYGGGQFDWDNIGSKHRGIDEIDKGQFDEVAETGIFSGACVLIKKEVLEKSGPPAGGFDAKYFLYFEDSDLMKRVKDKGFKIYYNGQTSIYHKVSRSTGIGSEITDYYHTRNRLIFGMQYAKSRTKFALLREAVKLFIFGRRAQRKGVLDYYLGIIGGIDEISKPEYPIKLSIGIVNYNTANLTRKLLQSIPKASDIEIIVLDNGNLDSCKDWIKDFPVKYLQNNENEGFSKGYNKTIKYALGEYYLMLNSDIEVLPGSLKELVKIEDELKGETVLGGKLLFPDKSDQDSVFHLPTIRGAFKEYFLAQKGSYFMYLPKGEKPVKVEGMVMACLLIPKKILNKAGLLDEGTFIFFEDIEYSRRLKEFNISVYFVPGAKFIHHHGSSTKKVGWEKSYALLQKASKHYHGKIYYYLLTLVLKLGQKLGRVKTPTCRWVKD